MGDKGSQTFRFRIVVWSSPSRFLVDGKWSTLISSRLSMCVNGKLAPFNEVQIIYIIETSI